MAKTFSQTLYLLLVLSLFSCQGTPTKNAAQTFEIEIDGAKRTADPVPIISSSYTGARFMLGYLSDKDDLQFSISAYLPDDLQAGIYQVYECKQAAECDEKAPDNNQVAMFGPYPKDPMPPTNLSRTAYYAPRLGLSPLALTITSVKDEKQIGNPLQTKRVEGEFSGNMAYVEQQPGGSDWSIVGKTAHAKGKFSVLCSIR